MAHTIVAERLWDAPYLDHRVDGREDFARFIAEWPPEGGFSSVCDAVPLSHHQDLQERSIALLRAIGWEGCAMVEYRLDDATGEAALMEVNGRFWGSFPLAVQAGAGFANLAYHLQGLGQTPELPPLTEELRCRMVTTELKRLVRILLHGLSGPIEVEGKTYNGAMPAFGPKSGYRFNEQKIAAVLTYVRNAWGNSAPAITPERVKEIMAAAGERPGPWTGPELDQYK